MTGPILAVSGAVAEHEWLGSAAMDFVVEAGAFAVVEVEGRRRAAAFADLCMGLVPLAGGAVRVLGRDWTTLTAAQADALRGRIGRLFAAPLRADTPDVAARVLLGRLYHTRRAEAGLRSEAAALAVRCGLPGLPSGPARLLSDGDLVRAACVRAFLGGPGLLLLEMSAVVQDAALLAACLGLGAEARGRGAAVVWLVAPGFWGAGLVGRYRSLASIRMRLGDEGLGPLPHRRAA